MVISINTYFFLLEKCEFSITTASTPPNFTYINFQMCLSLYLKGNNNQKYTQAITFKIEHHEYFKSFTSYTGSKN